jgi:hypothetical protein
VPDSRPAAFPLSSRGADAVEYLGPGGSGHSQYPDCGSQGSLARTIARRPELHKSDDRDHRKERLDYSASTASPGNNENGNLDPELKIKIARDAKAGGKTDKSEERPNDPERLVFRFGRGGDAPDRQYAESNRNDRVNSYENLRPTHDGARPSDRHMHESGNVRNRRRKRPDGNRFQLQSMGRPYSMSRSCHSEAEVRQILATWIDITAYAQRLGGVAEATSYGEPSLMVGKALLTRLRVADCSIVLKYIDPDERDLLMSSAPELFFLEDHYRSHDIVLARLSAARTCELLPFVERAWRHIAPKRLVAAYDNARAI